MEPFTTDGVSVWTGEVVEEVGVALDDDGTGLAVARGAATVVFELFEEGCPGQAITLLQGHH